MRFIIKHCKGLDRIDIKDVRNCLLSFGWRQSHSKSDVFEYWSTIGFNGEITLPLDGKDRADFRDSVQIAIHWISYMAGVSEMVVLDQMGKEGRRLVDVAIGEVMDFRVKRKKEKKAKCK